MTSRPNPVPLRPDYSATRARAGDAFARSVYARVQAAVHRRDVAEFIPRDDRVTPAIIERANQTVGSTTTPGWASELVQDAWRQYLVELAPYSGAARLIEQAVQATSSSFSETFYPVRTGPAVPAWVGEGDPIPVRSETFSLITLGPARKLASIIAWSRELGKRSDAEAIFATMLREDVSAGLDAAFFSDAAADTARPAGLLNGVTPIAGFAGGDLLALENDLVALGNAVAGSGNVTYICTPDRLMRLRILAPTLFPAVDVVASASVPSDRIIAADARALLVSVDPSPEVFISNVGTVHLSDTPAEIVSDAPVTADPVRGLWQTATLAARLIHEITFVKRRATAVAYLDSASW